LCTELAAEFSLILICSNYEYEYYGTMMYAISAYSVSLRKK